jgi:hypothetical protein
MIDSGMQIAQMMAITIIMAEVDVLLLFGNKVRWRCVEEIL